MKKFKKALFIAGVATSIVGFLNSQLIVEKKVPLFVFVGVDYLCPLAVCLIGYVAWRQCPVNWPSKVWLLVYGAYLLLCSVLLFLNNYAHALHYPHEYFAPNKHISVNSPLPLLLLYFIFTRVSSKPAEEKNNFQLK